MAGVVIQFIEVKVGGIGQSILAGYPDYTCTLLSATRYFGFIEHLRTFTHKIAPILGTLKRATYIALFIYLAVNRLPQ
jgi:hypothetical protein